MSVNSSSGISSVYNKLGIKNTGIGGLVSGLDTESLVEALTSGTRAKIAKQGQTKTMLKWQQTAYRSVANALSTFQEKHVYYGGIGREGGASVINSSLFFNTYKGTISSSGTGKVTFRGSDTSAVGSIKINSISHVADYERYITKGNFSSQILSESPVNLTTTDFSGKTLSIKMGSGSTKTIALDSLNAFKHDETLLAGELEDLINTAVGAGRVTVTASGSAGAATIKLDSPLTDKEKITVTSASKELGFTANMSNRVNPNTATLGQLLPGLGAGSHTFKINGEEFTFKDTDTVAALCNKVTTSKANVSLIFSEATQQFTFTAKVSGTGNNIDIEDVDGNLMNLLVGARGSNSLTSSHPINMGYNPAGITNPGANAFDAKDYMLNNENKTLSFKLTVGGQSHDISVTIPAEDSAGNGLWDGKSADQYLKDEFNKQIREKFGDDIANKVSLDVTGGAGAALFTVKAPINLKVTLESPTNASHEDFATKAFGATPKTNVDPAFETKLSDLGLSGNGSFTIKIGSGTALPVNWSDSMTIDQFVQAINTQVGSVASVVDGVLKIDAGGDNSLKFEDDTGTLMATVFGKSDYDSGTVDLSAREHKPGKNAEIEVVVDGQTKTLYNENNIFDVNGIVFEVHEEHTTVDAITVTSKSDPDELIDKIRGFVDEYNAMVKSLNTLIYEKKEDGYAPLTDEQKAEMSEEQIKSWENEAKKGMLYNDATLRGILSEMRLAMTKKVEAAGLSLYDIGIEPESYLGMSKEGGGYDYSKAGTFTIKEDRLRKAIEENPDGVRVLFTNKVGYGEDSKGAGIAETLNQVITKATKVTSDPKTRGTLVSLAGTESNIIAENTSEIGSKIDRIDKYVANLKMRLEMEYKRHWSKFTALETALQRMSAQSSWLTENTSG